MTAVHEAANYLESIPTPVRELLVLDQLQGSRAAALLGEAFHELRIVEPSVSEAAQALSFRQAQAIALGRVEPREGAMRLVEILDETEGSGAPPKLVPELVEFHRLLTMRDDAAEIASRSSGERALQFSERVKYWDQQICDYATSFLLRAGLDESSTLEAIQAAAAR